MNQIMGMMFPRETKAIIECLLFVSKEPLTLKVLALAMNMPENEIKILADELMSEYKNDCRGINIELVAHGYQMCTKPEMAGYIEKLYKPQGTHGLSKAALETLAIVAYKQPITRAEIEAIRGVKVDSAIGTLVEKNLVKEVGRKEGPGRPMLFGTTSSFLRYFGLRDLADLPDPDEFTRCHVGIEEKNAGMEGEEDGF
ncbi:SMC-Scp complex subunit ScpB [Phosphitispora sp. TUW77]|uniref:SMC-Scp complex subunit ScpB n=1 Tax=Phosphitispora sp. TUW77 TaxID=3152361 RepID=UPI003AB478F1